MKQSHIAALVLGVASITAGTAIAQSAKTNPWEGADVAASFGYAQFVPSIGTGSATYFGNPAGSVISSADNVTTPTGSISAGYNWGITSEFLLGLRASYYPGASASASGSFTVGASSDKANYNVKNLYSIVLTPGYALDKDRLVYAKVGYTGATIGLNGDKIAYQSVNLTGYSLGLGYKQMISNSLYLMGEINYAKFSDTTASLTTTDPLTVIAPFGGKGTDVLVGIGYRF